MDSKKEKVKDIKSKSWPIENEMPETATCSYL